MAVIQIDTDILRQASSQITDKLNELQTLNASLNTIIGAIAEGWSGQASTQYHALMKNYAKQANQFQPVFQELKKYADETVNSFEDLDASCSNKIEQAF